MSRVEATADLRRVAALHHTAGVWRAVVAMRSNGSFALIDSREFRRAEHSQIETWLDQHQVGRTLVVLPASNVICRTAQLPEASPDQLRAALELQAETYLPEIVPSHRRAMAVLPQASGESTRGGLILAWPQNAPAPELPLDREVSFAPDIAALAALMNGERTSEAMLWADREDGSIALAIPHAQGELFRASRENADTNGEWKRSVDRLIVETALNAGHTDAFTDELVEGVNDWLEELTPDAGRLLLPEVYRRSAAARLTGARDDDAWWSRFGVAAGAILLTLDELSPLAALRQEAPIESPNAIDRVLSKLATRRAAALWLIAALVLLGMGPLAFSGLKLLTMYQKVGPLEEFNQTRVEQQARINMYQALAKNTWPMQKLLSDIGNCAPAGITFSTISLEEGAGKVDIQGETTDAGLVIEMVRTMRDSHVFEDVQPGYSDREAGNTKFSITATVRNPYHTIAFKDDFAETPLTARLYPDEYRMLQEMREGGQPPQALRDSGEGDEETMVADVRDTGGGEPIGRGPGNTDEFGRSGPRSIRPQANIPALAGDAPKPELPAPIPQEDLDKIGRAELIAAMAKVKNSMNLPGLTEEQQDALDNEFQRLREHLMNMPR